MPDALARYRDLRARIDQASGRLVDMHCRHLACKPGCHDCCTDLTVSAVEYVAIRDDLRAAGVRATDLPYDPSAACPFLRGGLCALYRYRPLICRTHGLPIAFLNDDEEELAQVNVSFCPKNFTDAEPEELDFGPENTLDLEELNAELAEINLRHVEEASRRGQRPPVRIPLRQLRDELRRQR